MICHYISLNLHRGVWIIVTLHCATPAVVGDLSELQPLESSRLQLILPLKSFSELSCYPWVFFARFSQISNFWSCYESYFQITQLWMSPKESSTYYWKFYQWQIFTLTLSVLLNNIIAHPIKAVLTVNVCNCVPWKASIKWITPPFVANKIIFPSELNLTPVHSMLGSFWMWKVENGPWRKQFTYA